MTDRDIPSVPVTTLAGITSLSDLLSELPISDPLSIQTSLNKTLLFHPRVAEEANNLLAEGDQSLVQQLVQAIEQTNSNHIELKEEFTETSGNQFETEIPQLLQTIYNFKPNVFNNPAHSAHQNIVHRYNIQHPQQYNQQQIPSQHQSLQRTVIQNQFNQNFQSTVHNQQYNVIQQNQQPSLYHQQSITQQNQLQINQLQHNLSNDFNEYNISNQTGNNNQATVNWAGSNQAKGVISTPGPPNIIQHSQQLQNQPQNIINYVPQQIPSPNNSQTIHRHPSQQQVIQSHNNQQHVHQQLPPTHPSSHPSQLKLQHFSATQLQQQPVLIPQQQTVITQQQLIVTPQSVPQNVVQNQLPNSPKQNQTHLINQHITNHQTQRSSHISPSSELVTSPYDLQNQQSITNLQPQSNQKIPMNSSLIVNHQNTNALETFNHSSGGSVNSNINELQQNQNITQKVVPRNNEYLEKQQQNKNFDLRGPSPAQANDALESTQIPITNSNKANKTTINESETFINRKSTINFIQDNKLGASNPTVPNTSISKPVSRLPAILTNPPVINVSSNSAYTTQPNSTSTSSTTTTPSTIPTTTIQNRSTETSVLKVRLELLQQSDLDLLQESISTFSELKPKLAMKLGILKEETSIFSKMKADDSLKISLLGKRKALEDDKPAFTKPKLRKIERKIVKTPTKMSKEDIIKSNNYQRFISIMEQILEHLDDSETLLNLEDNYENIDLIPTNLLMNISAEAAKLKAKGNAIELLPQNKLTMLITYAMRSIHVSKNVSAGPDVGEELGSEECVDKILNAVEAALLVCNIYSCRNTSSLQEDNVDAIIKFIQFQLRETIFPSYDAVYTVESKKKSKKNSKSSQQKEISRLFSKTIELTKILVTLISKFQFVDTIIIHASALGIEPFFVDNIETLQFVCLDLVTTIFQNDKYRKHRHNILTEILSSIDRLSGSKRNLRPYKLTNNAGNIQMISALVLQLVQCSVILPDTLYEDNSKGRNKKTATQPNNDQQKTNKADNDIFIREKYQQAINIGGNFLSSFLQKCRNRSGEYDFRPIFENFIEDLLITVNKPEWPGAELLLSLLGTLLVNSMSDKSKDQTVRVTSLEYLGIVAARLRKDTVVSRCKVNTMDQLIKLIKIEQEKEGDQNDENIAIEIDPEEERIEFLQRILLDFLAVNAQEENIVWSQSRHFYLTQWYADILHRKKKIAEGEKSYASRKKTPKKKRRHKTESDSSEEGDDEDDKSDDEKKTQNVDQELNLEIYRILDKRKGYLLSKISPFSDASKVQDIKTYIDYNNAQLIAQYLASKRSFSQSFDKYLQKIILVVREPSIAIRTKAMKCLAHIVEVDPSILARKDMQMGVNQKFLDTSISVREAAVDLVGKYVLLSPDLINQYYDMLSKRILDTGVSVRKRVIKILRDICVSYPDFEKIPEICVKMIRRVNDEEGIQKLVTEVFLSMWFTPAKENDKKAVNRKIYQIIDVVNSSHDTGMQWLDGLLKTIFTSKESKEDTTVRKEPSKTIITACHQIVDGLVHALMKLEEDNNSKKLLGCVTTLNLFAKIRPILIVQHAITLEPYLSIKCSSNDITRFISIIAEILEQVVPLMEHPSEIFLSDLETHLMMLVVVHNQTVLLTCIACLAAVVNKLTKNYKLIRDCFSKYYKGLGFVQQKLIADPDFLATKQSFVRRSIYIVGLFMRYFNFNNPEVYGENCTTGVVYTSNLCDEVFQTLMEFLTYNNADIIKETLKSLGSFCVTNYEYLTKPELREFYHDLLSLDTVSGDMKTIVLRNILTYLHEEEQKHIRNDTEWNKTSQQEDLKEMGDVSSGMSSRIIQLYLKDILNCFLQRDYNVRLWAMKVTDLVLKQGLVHPVQIVPYLICLSTDVSKDIAHTADYHLQDIDKNHSGFINMKTYAGIHLSFELQTILQLHNNSAKLVRGFRINNKDEAPTALNGFLYSLLRNTKPQRRALIQSITKQFDEQRTSLRQMLYLADNLAYFPYLVQDEPLYIIHQIDVLISVTGTNLLSNFREGLKPLVAPSEIDVVQPVIAIPLDEDDDDDKDSLFSRLPENTTDLRNCIRAAQGCMLLLILKQHLKDCYGLTDGKISQYSPSESGKIYDKQMQRKSVPTFKPQATMELIEEDENTGEILDDKKKMELVTRYLDFKQLMLNIDPEDPDLEEEDSTLKTTAISFGSTIVDGTNPIEKPIDNNIDTNTLVNNQTPAKIVVPSSIVQHNSLHKREITPLVRSSGRHKQVSKTVTPRKTDSKKKKNRRKMFSSSSEESDSDPDYE